MKRERDAARSFARERHRHAGDRQAADGQRRCRRQNAVIQIPDVQVFAVHRRARLRHLRGHRPADSLGLRTHRERDPQIADEGRDDVAAPGAAFPVTLAAAQPDACRIDRFLTERPESLALKGCLAEPHVALRKKRFQTVVGGPGEEHPSKDLEALIRRERGADGGTPQKSVAGLDDVVHGLFEAANGRHTGSGLGQIDGGKTLQARAKFPSEGLAHGVDRGFIPRERGGR